MTWKLWWGEKKCRPLKCIQSHYQVKIDYYNYVILGKHHGNQKEPLYSRYTKKKESKVTTKENYFYLKRREQRKKSGTEELQNRQKTINKTAVSTDLPLIILNVNWLIFSTRHRVPD